MCYRATTDCLSYEQVLQRDNRATIKSYFMTVDTLHKLCQIVEKVWKTPPKVLGKCSKPRSDWARMDKGTVTRLNQRHVQKRPVHRFTLNLSQPWLSHRTYPGTQRGMRRMLTGRDIRNPQLFKGKSLGSCGLRGVYPNVLVEMFT